MRKKKLVFAALALLLLSLSAAPVLANLPPPGVGTPGFWKNHPEAWPVEQITFSARIDDELVEVTYSKDDAIEYMSTREKGDKTYTLFRALVAAWLNRLAGNPDCPIPGSRWTVDQRIWQAMQWLVENPVSSGVKGSSAEWQRAEHKYEDLDAYNNGLLCAPSRDDLE